VTERSDDVNGMFSIGKLKAPKSTSRCKTAGDAVVNKLRLSRIYGESCLSHYLNNEY
jgi:hypothetical protein